MNTLGTQNPIESCDSSISPMFFISSDPGFVNMGNVFGCFMIDKGQCLLLLDESQCCTIKFANMDKCNPDVLTRAAKSFYWKMFPRLNQLSTLAHIVEKQYMKPLAQNNVGSKLCLMQQALHSTCEGLMNSIMFLVNPTHVKVHFKILDSGSGKKK